MLTNRTLNHSRHYGRAARCLLMLALLLVLPAVAHASDPDPADPFFRTVVYQGCIAGVSCQTMTIHLGTVVGANGPSFQITGATLVSDWVGEPPSQFWEFFNWNTPGQDCDFAFTLLERAASERYYGGGCKVDLDWAPETLTMHSRGGWEGPESTVPFTGPDYLLDRQMPPYSTAPEPATMILMGTGLAAAAVFRRRRCTR